MRGFRRIAALLGLAGVISGGLETKADGQPKPDKMSGPTPIYKTADKPAGTNQIFQYQQKNWGKPGNPANDQISVIGTDFDKKAVQDSEGSSAVENVPQSDSRIAQGKTFNNGGFVQGGVVRGGGFVEGGFVPGGRVGGRSGYNVDRVSGDGFVHVNTGPIGIDRGNQRAQQRFNQNVDQVSAKTGGKFVGTHVDDAEPVHRNPFTNPWPDGKGKK